jgi:hypothetical protein
VLTFIDVPGNMSSLLNLCSGADEHARTDCDAAADFCSVGDDAAEGFGFVDSVVDADISGAARDDRSGADIDGLSGDGVSEGGVCPDSGVGIDD